MLRELEKGEKALVLKPYSVTSRYKVGDIGTFSDIEDRYCVLDVGGEPRACVKRRDLLAIGDKVVRGPDWQACYVGIPEGAIGVVTKFNNTDAASGHNVEVCWPSQGNRDYRMTSHYQDLKPTGDSEGTEAVYKHPGGDTITITESKEDTMTREKRAVEADEQKAALIEEIAQKQERVEELAEKAGNLRKYKTDKAETVAQIVSVRKCTKKQAEDWLALRDKEIEV